MKKLAILAGLLVFVVMSFAQQTRFTNSQMQSNNYCIKTQSPYQVINIEDSPIEVTDSSYDAVFLKAKEEAFKRFFTTQAREFSCMVSQTLAWHAGNLIQIPKEDIYQKGKRWHAHIEKFRIQADATKAIAQALDKFFSLSTIVIYNPNFFIDDEDFGELIRSQLQSAYVNAQCKRTGIKSLDRMPKHLNIPGNPEDINYYDTLLKVIDQHLGGVNLNPRVAIIVRDYRWLDKENSMGLFYYKISLHIQIVNLETYSIVLDKYITGEGANKSSETAKLNAVKAAIQHNYNKLVYDETQMYYNYIINGREAIITILPQVFNGDYDVVYDFIDKLEQYCIVVNEESEINGNYVLKIYTQAPTQSMLRRNIYRALKASQLPGTIRPDGGQFKIVPKKPIKTN